MKILIVGSGFSGSVIANEIAKSKKIKSIDVLDERNHIAGNCHTEKDKLTGIIVHKYGPHIFHTSNKRVWDYINQFDDFENYYHRIKTIHKNKVFSFPINLHTLNQFFNTNLSPIEADKFLKTKSVNFESPKNFEEQALKFVGKEIYDAFFYGYTKKQWGCDPKDIPASVLKRIPVRFNYDDRYHFSLYSGIPKNGYTHIIESMLDSKKIKVHLNTKYNYSDSINNKYDYTFYTGPIDGFFNFKFKG